MCRANTCILALAKIYINEDNEDRPGVGAAVRFHLCLEVMDVLQPTDNKAKKKDLNNNYD